MPTIQFQLVPQTYLIIQRTSRQPNLLCVPTSPPPPPRMCVCCSRDPTKAPSIPAIRPEVNNGACRLPGMFEQEAAGEDFPSLCQQSSTRPPCLPSPKCLSMKFPSSIAYCVHLSEPEYFKMTES